MIWRRLKALEYRRPAYSEVVAPATPVTAANLLVRMVNAGVTPGP